MYILYIQYVLYYIYVTYIPNIHEYIRGYKIILFSHTHYETNCLFFKQRIDGAAAVITNHNNVFIAK